MKLNSLFKKHLFSNADIYIIAVFCIVPLFLSFPYRVNIFLSWEGAYRLYSGEIPYKDFGLPMGFAYWVIPALFFKLFGPYFISLVKAQVFLNLLCSLSFRGILKKLNVPDGIRICAVLTLCISYILINFWPWYNNSVIIWEIVGLNFLFAFMQAKTAWRYVNLFAASFFLFTSFFTKQDGGFLAFIIALVLISYNSFITKKWKDVVLFLCCYFIIGFLIILPFTNYNFGYWFNYGQPPHTPRLSASDMLDEIFGGAQWIKFYLLLIILLLLIKVRNLKTFLVNKNEMLFLLLTSGILAEAAIFEITSYTPPDNNIFFHAFAIAYIGTAIADIGAINFNTFRNFFALAVLVLLWWSGSYWQYINRITMRIFPAQQTASNNTTTSENIINRHTFMINLDTAYYEDESTWQTVPALKSFKNMYLPPSAVSGIERLIKMPIFKNTNARVLNMTELTSLDYELNYKLETGSDFPLWYHLGVCMFNKQCDTFCNRIRNKEYDVVMFENVPSLNNFFPFRVRDSLQVYYKKTDEFLAPRRPTNGKIEIYTK